MNLWPGCARTPENWRQIMSKQEASNLRYHDFYSHMSYADFLAYQANPNTEMGETISMNGRGL